MRTEKSDVYSMTGIFVENHTPNLARYFGGFFSVRTYPNEPRRNIFAMPFNGSLADIYGMSDISGEINPGRGELEFDKKYIRRDDTIKYAFKRNENGIWVGEYCIGSAVREHPDAADGKAFVKINLDWEGVDMLLPEFTDPETWAKGLVQQMVNDGRIRCVRDEGTGEEVIVPNEQI